MLTLSAEQIQFQAERHDKAESDRQQIQATTLTHPEMTIKDAYAIQKKWMDLKIQRGYRIVGHKIGLTSKVMQRTMSIDEPDFGTLLDNICLLYTSDAADD